MKKSGRRPIIRQEIMDELVKMFLIKARWTSSRALDRLRRKGITASKITIYNARKTLGIKSVARRKAGMAGIQSWVWVATKTIQEMEDIASKTRNPNPDQQIITETEQFDTKVTGPTSETAYTLDDVIHSDEKLVITLIRNTKSRARISSPGIIEFFLEPLSEAAEPDETSSSYRIRLTTPSGMVRASWHDKKFNEMQVIPKSIERDRLIIIADYATGIYPPMQGVTSVFDPRKEIR